MNKTVSTEIISTDNKKSILNINIRDYTMIIALVFIWIVLTVLTDGFFIGSRNLSNLMRSISVTSALSLGIFLIIVAGHIDFSTGSVCGFIGAIAAILNVWLGWGTFSSIVVALFLGMVIGFAQGYLVAYQKVPAFIVTLGGLMIFRGLLVGVTRGITVAPLSASFVAIGQNYVLPVIGWIIAGVAVSAIWVLELRTRSTRLKYGFSVSSFKIVVAKSILYSGIVLLFVAIMNNYRGIPLPVFIIMLIALSLAFVACRTQFGRYVFALGGNIDAARLSGINVELTTMVLFVVGGFMSGVGGIILTSRLNAATTDAGNMYEFDAIAACIIGGTSIKGGAGTVIGVIVGALVMASLDNGMSLLNTNTFWQHVVKGVILIAAVWFDINAKNKKI
ncbi:MAG: sugar ABC transporter permease [Spirochaetes bacterium]|nr:sugar ABC transporter permease [Spirochaetota bacterium]MBN2769559.1 sugar ABC transporter permease [Spirochaetota bacterium]